MSGPSPEPGTESLARLWLWMLIPPLLVAAGVLWMWLGAEGGMVEAGRYRVS